MRNNFVQVLSIRPFLFLWLAEIFSQLAINMMNFILIILAFKLSNSNTAVSGVVLSFTIPSIIFGLLAGVYVDRWNKKQVLYATNILRMMLIILLAIFHSSLYGIYFLSFLISTVTQFFIPAEVPFIPLIVNDRLLLSANALFGMGVYGSILIAYILSGVFLLWFGSFNVFIFLASLFLIAALFISLMVVKDNKKSRQINSPKNSHKSLRFELKSAFYLVAKTRKVYNSILLLTLSQVLIMIIGVIGPGYAKHILGIKVEEFTYLLIAPAALGMVIGVVYLGRFSNKFSKETIVNLGVFLSGIAMLLLPYGSRVASKGFVQIINLFISRFFDITILHFMMVLALVLGFANAFVFVPSNTILQEETTDELRGKIYGILSTLAGIFSLLPIVIVGGLADKLGVGPVLSGIGVSLCLLAVVRYYLNN